MEESQKQELFQILDQRCGTSIPNEQRIQDLLSALLSFQFQGYNENLLREYINQYIEIKQQKIVKDESNQIRMSDDVNLQQRSTGKNEDSKEIHQQVKENERLSQNPQLILYVVNQVRKEDFLAVFGNDVGLLKATLLKILRHFQTFVSRGQLDINQIASKGSIRIKDVEQPQMGQQRTTPILNEAKDYQIIPLSNFILESEGFSLTNQSIEYFQDYDRLELELVVNQDQFFDQKQTLRKTLAQQDSQILITKRFIQMLKYFSNQSYRHLENQDIQFCYNIMLNQHFLNNPKPQNIDLPPVVGYRYYAEQIIDELPQFTASPNLVRLPQGILFWGPPRTGKTYSSQIIIKALNLYRVYDDMAAGDFNRPYVGESQEMVNLIADRCDVFPWELCVLFIDEIDGIAPNRTAEGASGHKIDMLSVFLSVMDGNQTKPNFLVIGTTNRLADMDEAFKQRFDIKLFIGLPNRQSRKNYIETIVSKMKPDYKDIEKLLDKINSPKFINYILDCTINFSADSMRKAVEDLIITLSNSNIDWRKGDYEGDLLSFIHEVLLRICQNDKRYISKYLLPDLVKINIEDQSPYLKFKYEFSNYFDMKYYTKRIFIDMSEKDASNLGQQIQFEWGFPKKSKEKLCDESSIKILEDNLKDISVHRNNFVKLLQNLYQRFPEEIKVFEQMTESMIEFSLRKKVNNLNSYLYNFNNEQRIKLLKRIMLFQEMMENSKQSLVSFKFLNHNLTNESLFSLLIPFALQNNVNYFVYIDQPYFQKEQIFQDDQMARKIVIQVEEALQYERCLIVFDLDSIADLTQEYSGLKEDIRISSEKAYSAHAEEASFSYSINNSQTYRLILNIFAHAQNHDRDHWFVVICKHQKLALDFREQSNWLKTDSIQKQQTIIESLNQIKRCSNCYENFVVKSNSESSCATHTADKLYVMYELDVTKKAMEEDINREKQKLQKDDVQALSRLRMTMNQNLWKQMKLFTQQDAEELILNEVVRSEDFRWFCCGQTFYEKGEIQSKHVPIEICIRCNQDFINNQNGRIGCKYLGHEDWMFHKPTFLASKQQLDIYLKLPNTQFSYEDQSDQIQQQPESYVFVCCGQSGIEPGCKNIEGHHSNGFEFDEY